MSNDLIEKRRLALEIFCSLLTNQRTPYDAPKVVERLMRDSLDYADMWVRICNEEVSKQ